MTAPAWRVRRMQASDVGAVLAIQQASLEAAVWSATDYERVVGQQSYASVAEGQGGIAGFLVARAAADELEILNMAVRPGVRRQGIAALLLADALDFGRASGATRVFLEVGESNGGAIAFYQRHGFAVQGRRARYYSQPVEDALILARALT